METFHPKELEQHFTWHIENRLR